MNLKNKRDEAKSILGVMKEKQDNIYWPPNITEMDKTIIAYLYLSPPIHKPEFDVILSLLGSERTVTDSLRRLEHSKYIAVHKIQGHIFYTEGKEVIKLLHPDIKRSDIEIKYLSDSSYYRYILKSHILLNSTLEYLRKMMNQYWNEIGEQKQEEWIKNFYITNVVYKRFLKLSVKDKKTYLFSLPGLTPDEKERMANSKLYNIKHAELMTIAKKKKWRKEGKEDEEYLKFRQNFSALIEKPDVVRFWTRSIVESEVIFGWLKKAIVRGDLTATFLHRTEFYKGVLNLEDYKENEAMQKIINLMIEYDKITTNNRSIARTVSGLKMSKKQESAEKMIAMIGPKEEAKKRLFELRNNSEISFNDENSDIAKALSYITLEQNFLLVDKLEKGEDGRTRIVIYLVDGGSDKLSNITYKKKVALISAFSNLLNVPVKLLVFSVQEGRVLVLKKKLPAIIEKLKMGNGKVDGNGEMVLWSALGHQYEFRIYNEPISKDELIYSLIS